MTVRSEDRKQFLFDVFVTALEGGIGYWSAASKYHIWLDAEAGKEDIDGFFAVIEIQDDDTDPDEEPTEYRIDAAVIARGIGLFEKYALGKIDGLGNEIPEHAQNPVGEGHYWRQFLLANRTNGEDGDYDADVADIIVQFGVFGEAVYG
ncbi:hypothetical protein SEA_JEEVES_89 [Mycobacterium phage Jeeves]|uniref:Uncharacterized protein n=1 Tax=Mycobacterium phage Jeeves TaxID=2652402 RepID=A0A5J6T2L0_9CAUD|nr:hypothetical protein KNU75_gp020 [Mycobacterium phage Jeeves]QFG04564.1 hypothetical protein SEA_JEEVES_89 [Mycobacterium phage Jeeves]